MSNRWTSQFETWTNLKSKLTPQRVWIQLPNHWTILFEAWTNLKSQINPPTCLDSNAKPLDHSIWDLGSPQGKSSLNVFGFKCQTVKPPNLRLEQISSLKLIPQRVWIEMPSRWTTRFETWVVPKPNHPSMCLDSNAKPLNHPIWDLDKFEVSN